MIWNVWLIDPRGTFGSTKIYGDKDMIGQSSTTLQVETMIQSIQNNSR